ncbi:MAG: type II toxin-antitoxin system RelE/ParE family toxin [Pyrinomonadaceae bacterium]
MAKYEVAFKRSVYKDLRPIPNPDVKRILSRIRDLAEDPRPMGCEKLSGQERYRVRQSVSRIIYAIEDNRLIVTAVKIAHRSTVYER